MNIIWIVGGFIFAVFLNLLRYICRDVWARYVVRKSVFKIKALESILCSIIRYAPDILELLAYLFYAVNIFLNTFISSIEIVANRIVALTIFFAFNNMFSKLYSMFLKMKK